MPHQAASPELLSRLEPLARLSAQSLRELAPLCIREFADRGADPFRLAGVGGQFVYLLSGELRLGYADASSEVIVGGSDAALAPLGRKAPSPVSARAITEVELLRIDDDLLDIMMTWDQLAAPRALDAAGGPEPADWRSMSGVFAAQTLTRGLFAALPPAHIEALLARFERLRMRAGEVVVREGEAGESYYVIESGRCEVTRSVGGATLPLAMLKAGDAFGEEALLAGAARNATVTLRSDGVLLRLAKDDFDTLLREPMLNRLTPVQASAKAAAGAQWIDVRFPAEFRGLRMPGAINLPLNEIRNAIGSLDPRREYIVYCQSGRRSSAAAFLLSQRGYRAFLLDGGLRGAAAGGP